MESKIGKAAKLNCLSHRALALTSLISTVLFQSVSAADGDYTGLTTDSASAAPVSMSAAAATPATPSDTPAYFRKVFRSYLSAPLPKLIYDQGGIPATVPQLEKDPNPFGILGSYQPGGETITANNAFFQSLGTNGRSCATCHQPPGGMSFSVRNVRQRFVRTGGKDPIFAPVDGANCPNQVRESDTSSGVIGTLKGKGTKSFADAHSLLLTKGLIRVLLPMPANAEFTLEVVSDPTTCNLDAAYNSSNDPTTGVTTRIVSVFRRPGISANLDFKTTTTSSAADGNSGNLMWDGREPTLRSQAISATLGHAQATQPPTSEEIDQIVAFERGIFSAQLYDYKAADLTNAGATGGPVKLSVVAPGQGTGIQPFDEYSTWSTAAGWYSSARKSVARGQDVFNNRAFTIANVGGFNDLVGNNFTGTCATCHNVKSAGSDLFPNSQRDIGIGGQGVAFGGPTPARDLPIFRLKCLGGTALFNPLTVTTNDPGKALITGKCADIGKKTIPSLRALAAHEPYFSDGSAATLLQLVEIYNKRFNIGLSAQDKTDLVNFLGAL